MFYEFFLHSVLFIHSVLSCVHTMPSQTYNNPWANEYDKHPREKKGNPNASYVQFPNQNIFVPFVHATRKKSFIIHPILPVHKRSGTDCRPLAAVQHHYFPLPLIHALSFSLTRSLLCLNTLDSPLYLILFIFFSVFYSCCCRCCPYSSQCMAKSLPLFLDAYVFCHSSNRDKQVCKCFWWCKQLNARINREFSLIVSMTCATWDSMTTRSCAIPFQWQLHLLLWLQAPTKIQIYLFIVSHLRELSLQRVSEWVVVLWAIIFCASLTWILVESRC